MKIIPEVSVSTEKLVQFRKAKGLSISDVAYALGYKTPTGYWLIEDGQRDLKVSILYKLSVLYGIAMEDFLDLEI